LAGNPAGMARTGLSMSLANDLPGKAKLLRKSGSTETAVGHSTAVHADAVLGWMSLAVDPSKNRQAEQ